MNGPKNAKTVIIRRSQDGGRHGHHGGAWKVAYADFVTAMMAFFLLLWLVSSANQATLRGLAEYFSDAEVHTGVPGGAGGVLDGFSLLPIPPMMPAAPFSEPIATSMLQSGVPAGEPVADAGASDSAADPNLQDEVEIGVAPAVILKAVEESPELRPLMDSLAFDETVEGLRIHLIDRQQVAMFPIGSDVMHPHTRRLLEVVVATVAKLRGRLSIRGHTDALPFAPGAVYDNWALSSDRANATRRAMLEAGLDPARIAEVVGKGDAEPLVPEDRTDPRNRRISIVLLRDPSAAPAAPTLPVLAIPPL